MSRSNPHEHGIVNPSARWFEWNGEKGVIRYYDKDAKQTVELALPFTFLLLDELSTVKGWHEPSKSSIYANEVKDTRQTRLVVKAFKAPGPLAEGLYQEIKDRVNTVGGYYHKSCYIAFKNAGDGLSIGNLGIHGAALGAWMDFAKQHRGDLTEKAVTIDDFVEGKHGRVTFRVPSFKVVPVSDATNKQAVALDLEVQRYLTAKLTTPTSVQVAQAAVDDYNPDNPPADYDPGPPPEMVTDDDIPF